MSKGIRIAKSGADVKSNSQNIYVDSATPLLKVAISGSGYMISDGVSRNMKWRGQYQGTTQDDVNGYAFDIVIPHDLGYVPMTAVYVDTGPGTNRRYCTNISGTTVAGGVAPFATATNKQLHISLLPAIFNTPPIAGEYGFFFYIFYDRVI